MAFKLALLVLLLIEFSRQVKCVKVKTLKLCMSSWEVLEYKTKSQFENRDGIREKKKDIN